MKFTPLKALMCLAGVVVMTGGVQAASGVLIAERTTMGTASPITTQVQIDSNHMRAEVATGPGATQIILFDGVKKVLDILDPVRKTYHEMTQADVERLGGQMQAAMAQMQTMMATMSPAQRAQMEQMMQGRGLPGMGAAPVKTEYRKVGTGRVGQWACDTYEGTQNGQKTSEICTVAPSVLGLTADDFAMARQLGEFFKSVIPQGASGQLVTVGQMDQEGFSGVPVRRVATVAGQETTTEITQVTHQSFDASTFEVPAGFTKQAFPGAMGMGRGRAN